MKIQTRQYLLFVFIVFSLSRVSNAQDKDSKRSLIAVLSAIQSDYGYQFNYAKDAVESYQILPPAKNLPFNQVLTYLKSVTDLDFSLVNDSFVLVTLKPKVSSKERLEILPEVIVPSYIVKGISKLNNGSFEIDFSEFSLLPGLIETDVLRSIQAFPGIQSVNENVSNISIRGGSHDQNLILWDGIKMYQSGHFFGLISMYNPQITQQVLLLKNGSDASYTDGVSGSISMRTDTEVNNHFKGNIGVNFIDANGFADIPIGKKSSVQVALRKSINDFIETPAYSNFFEKISEDTEVQNSMNEIKNSNKGFDFYDASLRWIYNMSDKETLRINFINVGNVLEFDENTADESRRSSISQNSIAGAVHYDKQWNAAWTTALEFYETSYRLKAINANIMDSQRFLQENTVSESSFKFKANYKLNDRFNLLNGYHMVSSKVNNLDDVDLPFFRNLVSEVLTTHGLFSQMHFKAHDGNTSLSAGLRFNYIPEFEKQLWEPRFSFAHKFLDHFSIELLGEMKHQSTSQVINFQNDFLGVEKRRWQISNNMDIPVIRSEQVSVGINYNKKGWQLSAEAYHKKVRGITSQSQGFQNQFEFSKAIGNYSAHGVDFIFRKQIQQVNAWLSYAYLNSNYRFRSLSEEKFPSIYNINHAVTIGTTYTLNNLKVSAGFNWFSGNPTTLPLAGNEIIDNQINFAASNSSVLDDYFKLDVSALYNFKLGLNTKADIGASVWNLFNRQNQINNFFRVNNGNVDETLQTSLGFYPNIVMRVYF